jgi:hypothetical protein
MQREESEQSNILDRRIAYLVGGGDRLKSRVQSMSWGAPEKVVWEFHPGHAQQMCNEMHDWVEAHPPGRSMVVHYNPTNKAKRPWSRLTRR